MSKTTKTSPFATAFKNAVNRGTPFTVAVNNIAKKNNKTTDYIWQSLYKAGICYRQKFNGQWIYFPCNITKCKSPVVKTSQFNFWQQFCEWCLINGWCTPQQLQKHCGSQQDFMTFCRKFWNKQYTTTTKTKKRTTGRKTRRTRTTATGNYKFPYVRKAA
jgi:hypothetical protein